MDWNTFLSGVAVLGIGGVGKIAWDTYQHVKALNGKVAVVATKLEAHEILDDERFRNLEKRLEE